MAKVRVLNFFNNMPAGVRPGDEIDLEDKFIEGYVKSGFVQELSMPEPEPRRKTLTAERNEEALTRPRRGKA